LCTQLGYRFTILNSTINQIKILLSNRINDFANKDFIGSIRVADIFNACIRRGLDRTSLERIKDNLSRIIQEKGIVVIQDAQIKGIIEKAKRSPDYRELFKKRGNEESALNDTIAKLYVESKRGENPREFVDVKCWFLHNSYSSYDYSIGRKIHERYLIGANELLVLLWLSSPAQGRQIRITDLARSGLTSYITKYRRAKNPSHEVLKNIKGNLFLFTEIKNHDVNQRDSFALSYDPLQRLDADKVYSLYLRSFSLNEPSQTSQTMIVPCAFDIKDFVNTVSVKNGTDEVKFRINYVSTFGKDSLSIVWKSSDIFTINLSENK
jgi:hypothetical protein